MTRRKIMHTEIFTALRDSGMAEEHAVRIAEAIPVSDDLATRADLQAVAHDLRESIHELRSELLRWMFISQGTFAALVVAMVKLL